MGFLSVELFPIEKWKKLVNLSRFDFLTRAYRFGMHLIVVLIGKPGNQCKIRAATMISLPFD